MSSLIDAIVTQHGIYEFYLNNRDLIEHFCSYFRETASPLIKTSAENTLSSISTFEPKMATQTHNETVRANALASMPIHQYTVETANRTLKLTRRELQCLLLLSKNKSAKESAQALGISHRTVEAYLDNLRLKLGFRLKSELLSFYQTNKLDRILFPE